MPEWTQEWIKNKDTEIKPGKVTRETNEIKRGLQCWARKIEVSGIMNIIEMNFLRPVCAGGMTGDALREYFLKENKFPSKFEYPGLAKCDYPSAISLVDTWMKAMNNEHPLVKTVAGDQIEYIKDRLLMYNLIKLQRDNDSNEQGGVALGDINKDLVQEAMTIYNNFPMMSIPTEKEIALEKILKTPLEMVDIFMPDMRKIGIQNFRNENESLEKGWMIIIDYGTATFWMSPEKKKVAVAGKSSFYPEGKRNIIQVAKLQNHEIWVHVLTAYHHELAGLGTTAFGRGYVRYQEGYGVYSEYMLSRDAFGREIPIAEPWHVLGIGKCREGANFQELYQFCYQYMLQYHEDLDALRINKGLEPKYQTADERKQVAQQQAYTETMRLKKGVHDPEAEGWSWSRDYIYLDGALVVEELAKHGLEKRLAHLRVAPEFYLPLVEAGIFPSEIVDIEPLGLEYLKENNYI